MAIKIMTVTIITSEIMTIKRVGNEGDYES
jgi:hypothetical protein